MRSSFLTKQAIVAGLEGGGINRKLLVQVVYPNPADNSIGPKIR